MTKTRDLADLGGGFIQTGTGAVQRTVESKLQDVVSVLDFIPQSEHAAIKAGTSNYNATNAIQAAINSVPVSGGAVYIPSGKYKCNSLTLGSNTKLFGAGSSSVLQWGVANSELAINSKTNVVVEDLLIDGGGQVGNVYTGLAGCNGISIRACSNVKISRVTVQNMGIVNQADPFGTAPVYDLAYSGYGIQISARTGPISGIRVSNCTVRNIAGTGYQKGDGFYIEAYNASGGTDFMDVVLDNCHASTCGRHCYTVAGESPESIPSGVIFNNCYGEKSGLDGCDIEAGYDVAFNNCIWKDCGNDQTYYNPVAHYGATYRLLAAIAVDNASKRIVINSNFFEGCYYGFTYGSSDDIQISNSTFRNSTSSDIVQGLATGAVNIRLNNCRFLSSGNLLNYYREDVSGFVATGCTFTGTVNVTSIRDGSFNGCRFLKGLTFTGGSGYNQRNRIIGCTFENFAGSAITSASSGSHSDMVIQGNTFIGTGQLVNGISLPYLSASSWIINGNKFIGLTGSGVELGNGADHHYADITNNTFESCANGVSITQAIRQSLIAGNTFGSISNWCIAITSITAGTPMPAGPSIMHNTARTGCVNGITISLSTGSYDKTMLIGNNVSACSGTKWSLAGGNANGIVANNITT